jgi:hypothetical protein
MPTIEQLQAKRGALIANLEQIVGQANRLNGAVAVIDELLKEAADEAEAAPPAPAPPLAPETLPPPVAPEIPRVYSAPEHERAI